MTFTGDNRKANKQKYKHKSIMVSMHTRTHLFLAHSLVQFPGQTQSPWCSWEIVSMPGPTKASFQPPACLTCAGSVLCFMPRDP